jgi:hypothetical protein
MRSRNMVSIEKTVGRIAKRPTTQARLDQEIYDALSAFRTPTRTVVSLLNQAVLEFLFKKTQDGTWVELMDEIGIGSKTDDVKLNDA